MQVCFRMQLGLPVRESMGLKFISSHCSDVMSVNTSLSPAARRRGRLGRPSARPRARHRPADRVRRDSTACLGDRSRYHSVVNNPRRTPRRTGVSLRSWPTCPRRWAQRKSRRSCSSSSCAVSSPKTGARPMTPPCIGLETSRSTQDATDCPHFSRVQAGAYARRTVRSRARARFVPCNAADAPDWARP